MTANQELSHTHCLNCGAPATGEFCHECGQRTRDNTDRSLHRLTGEFFSNIFFLDNRFFVSLWYLIRYPSRMTVEFLDGRRKKFISPVTLFLFFNLIYFFLQPLTDYSLTLYDQTSSQPYSSWVKGWVDTRLQNQGLDFQDYSLIYQNASDNISKSIMIINIPMIAFFVYLITLKKRRFYFDSLIFSFHFFTLFMVCWVTFDLVGSVADLLGVDEKSLLSSIIFNWFTLILPLLYAVFSIKKFTGFKWYWAIFAGLGIMIGVGIANFLYRLIIFLITFWAT